MSIRSLFLTFILMSISNSIHANTVRDSTQIDPRWKVWSPSITISKDGHWALIVQEYPNNRKLNKSFVIGTNTKEKREITGVEKTSFMKGDRLAGIEGKELVVLDLKDSNMKEYLGEVTQFEVLDDSGRLLVFAEQTLKIVDVTATKPKILWQEATIKKYLINKQQSHILYQKKDDKTLYQLVLKSLKQVPLFDLEADLGSVTWNERGDAFTLIEQDYSIHWVDLKNHKQQTIAIPKATGKTKQIQTKLFSNNDVYVSYSIKPLHKNPEDEYLDIWNGNARDLHLPDRSVKYDSLKAFVYDNRKNSLTELERNQQKEYLHLGIPNYIISYDPFEFVEYASVYENKRYVLEQISPRKIITELTQTPSLDWSLNVSPNERFLLYPKDSVWELYDFVSQKKRVIKHTHEDTKPVWSSDSKKIYYQNGSNLEEYTLKTEYSKVQTDFKSPNVISIQNQIREANSTYANVKMPLVFTVTRYSNPATSIYNYHNKKITKIVDRTPKRINTQYLSRAISEDGNTVVWTEEDYDQSPRIKAFTKDKLITLLEAELPLELYNWRQQKVITYKDKYGTELTGLLYYPKNFDSKKKYPMITYIYQRVGSSRNIFEIPSFYNQNGFNQALYNELGYFVFKPDTYVTEEGPGLSALDQVTLGVKEITQQEAAIDSSKIGLIGHSFGGYETSFIVTHSNLFAAAVSGAGVHDFIQFTYEYSYSLRKPNTFRTEKYQYDMRVSFGENPEKYLQNSPILYAHQVKTPLLLWAGMKDVNVDWRNTQNMYVALKRYKVPTIALFYKKQGHAISITSPDEQSSLTRNTVDWFHYYLKKDNKLNWIVNGLDYFNY